MADKKQSTYGQEPKKQRGLFKKRRGGVVLSKDEVLEIKAGRKKLREELRAVGEKDKKEFELTASSLGLYFDKNKAWALLKWFFVARLAWILLAAALVLLGIMFLISRVVDTRGHFTISMSDRMFREGFSVSDTEDFVIPTSHLFATPAVDVPCIAISDIPDDVDNYDGEHHGNYFAYTFYLKNEGEKQADYKWMLKINSESKSISDAAWIMIFEDGAMNFYAKPREDGQPEAIPTVGQEDIMGGFLSPPLYDHAVDQDAQYEKIHENENATWWRVIPKPFVSEDIVAEGVRYAIGPGEIHKYTVVVWLEGNDPDCTNELVGGHLGLEMYMALLQ